MDLTAFAAEVGTAGPVTIAGLATRGGPVPHVRVTRAPAGIESFLPDEMTVACGAGTSVAELQAVLAERGQFATLPEGGTVGGALAVGRAGLLRLGHGPVRDTVLQCHAVLADGAVVMAGGPTVKNVSGFDLCRVFVGARGTLGFFGAFILRTRPRPPARRWYSVPADPWTVRRALFRPSSVLWDGRLTWVCLEGHPSDLDEQAVAAGLAEVAGPPPLPVASRRVLEPAALRLLSPEADGEFVAEIGVGVVHAARATPAETPAVTPADRAGPVAAVTARLKQLFDPDGRMNPGREPRAAMPVATAPGAR